MTLETRAEGLQDFVDRLNLRDLKHLDKDDLRYIFRHYEAELVELFDERIETLIEKYGD